MLGDSSWGGKLDWEEAFEAKLVGGGRWSVMPERFGDGVVVASWSRWLVAELTVVEVGVVAQQTWKRELGC